MKKVFSVFLMFICLLVGAFTIIKINDSSIYVQGAQQQTVSENAVVDITSKAAYLIDASTGTCVYKSNEDKQLPIASMTKIMTLLLTFESIDSGALRMDTEVQVSRNATSMGGSQAYLEENEKYKISDLIKTVTVASSNDSAVALAEAVSGSVESFVSLMNERAMKLGMSNTHFANCTGLPAPMHYSSSKDVSTMMRELVKHKHYFKYTKIWTEDFVHPSGRKTNITNTNKLSRFYDGCDSGKTGYTTDAGHCLAASAMRGSTRLISVIIGAADSKVRFSESVKLLNYGFSNYESRIALENQPMTQTVTVKKGVDLMVQAVPARSYYEFCKKGQKGSELSFECQFDNNLVAPIAKGDRVGKVLVFKKGVMIDEVELLANNDVAKANFIDYLKRIIARWAINS